MEPSKNFGNKRIWMSCWVIGLSARIKHEYRIMDTDFVEGGH